MDIKELTEVPVEEREAIPGQPLPEVPQESYTEEAVELPDEKDGLEYIDINKEAKTFTKENGEAVEIDTINNPEPAVDRYNKKFATVRFTYKDKVIYRFELWTTEYVNENYKAIALKNIINNFADIVPNNMRKINTFFAIVGLIRYVFPKTMIDVPIDTDERTVCVTLENSVTEYIKYAKLKGMTIKIDIEE
jgi:hypothetical protein